LPRQKRNANSSWNPLGSKFLQPLADAILD
jgi:hypothetical protein